MYHWWQIWESDWSTNSLLKINLMPCVMLAPVLLSLKSCFLWSFVTVFFNTKIRYFFCISVAIQGSTVYDLFPWSRFSVDLCNQFVSVILLNIYSSATQPGRLSRFGIRVFFPHFESVAFVLPFFFFFNTLKWLEILEMIMWMQLERILCFISFILILCHHDLPRKSPSILMAVDKTYITFIYH